MAPGILITALVTLPMVVGTGLAYAGYRAYKRRQHPPHDVERQRNFERTRQNDEHNIQLQDFARPRREDGNFQQCCPAGVVPGNVALVAKPLPSPYVETTGREGLVAYPQPVHPVEDLRWYAKGKVQKDAQFREEELHGRPPWDWKRGELEQPGLYQNQVVELAAPKPMRAVTKMIDQQPVHTPYDAKDTRAADIWQRIEDREPLVTNSNVETSALDKSTGLIESNDHYWDDVELENVDLSHESKEWRNTKRPATPTAKPSSTPESFDSHSTIGNPSKMTFEQLERSIDDEKSVHKPTLESRPPADPMAERRRKFEEAKQREAKNKRRAEEERQRDVVESNQPRTPVNEARECVDEIDLTPKEHEENEKRRTDTEQEPYIEDHTNDWEERWMQKAAEAEARYAAGDTSDLQVSEHQQPSIDKARKFGRSNTYSSDRPDIETSVSAMNQNTYATSNSSKRSSHRSSYTSNNSSRPSSGDAPTSSYVSSNKNRQGSIDPTRSSYASHNSSKHGSCDSPRSSYVFNNSRPTSNDASRSSYASSTNTRTSLDVPQSTNNSNPSLASHQFTETKSSNRPNTERNPSFREKAASLVGRKTSDTKKKKSDNPLRSSLDNARVLREQQQQQHQRDSAGSVQSWEELQEPELQRSGSTRGQSRSVVYEERGSIDEVRSSTAGSVEEEGTRRKSAVNAALANLTLVDYGSDSD